MAKKITNLDIYNTRMSASLNEKLFFMNNMKNISHFVDFGCADGALIKKLWQLYPNVKYFGIDSNSQMLKLTKKELDKRVTITTKWIVPTSSGWGLNLSSIIHEVYSYCTDKEILNFWNYVFYSGFDYIFIRDMTYSDANKTNINIENCNKIKENGNKKQISQYEDRWGSLKLEHNQIHFLLKYRYVDNWDRELNENYLPISIEELYSKIPDSYLKTNAKIYVNQFTKNCIFNDFDISIEKPTHICMVLEKK